MSNELSFTNISTDDLSFICPSGITLHVLRLDKLHPVISGNKWFKLRYYLDEAIQSRQRHVVTFGGAWSNHILATAAACQSLGLTVTGIIRGERPETLSATLETALALGMQLEFVSREYYREKEIPPSLNISDPFIIPEGGYGEAGVRGAATILDHTSFDFTHVCCAVGTGTMIAGLLSRARMDQQVLGVSVLKNKGQPEEAIKHLLPLAQGNWNILYDYHFGGYARHDPELINFMNQFCKQTNVPSDFVYTGKLFYAVTDLIRKGYFPAASRLLLVHSGGLQGNVSLPPGTLRC